MDWRLVKKAVDQGQLSLNDSELDALYSFMMDLDEGETYVIQQAIDNGIDGMSPGNYAVYEEVKAKYSKQPKKMGGGMKAPQGFKTADGRMLYDNTRGDEMTIAEIYGEEKPAPVAAPKPVAEPTQDTIYGPDGTMYVDREFEPVERDTAQEDSNYDRLLKLGKDYGAKAMNKFFK